MHAEEPALETSGFSKSDGADTRRDASTTMFLKICEASPTEEVAVSGDGVKVEPGKSLDSPHGREEEPAAAAGKSNDIVLYDEHTGKVSTENTPLTPAEKHSQLEMGRLWRRLPQLRDFTLFRKIGEGTFSSVYLACLLGRPGVQFAIKHHVPTSLPSRIAWEFKCLKEIGGQDNVGGVETAFRRDDCTVFVLPYMPHARFSDYVLEMGVAETREYLRGLLTALARVHSFNVIHRDVKPSNYLYDREARRYMLVDFGLSCLAMEPAVSMETPSLSDVRKRKREAEPCGGGSQSKRRVLGTQPNGGGAPARPANGRAGPAHDAVKKQLFAGGRLADAGRDPANRVQPGKAACKENGFVFPREHCVRGKSPAAATTSTNRFTALTAGPTPPGTSYVRVQDSKASPLSLAGRGSDEGGACGCFGRPRVCTACLARPGKHVPRAGTPGFRPPEVLFKYPHQTTAVDVWAAGVVLLCVMSGCYPFFKSPSDISALAEITVVFGSEKVQEIAAKLGRQVQFSAAKRPLSLRRLCESLRSRGRRGASCADSPVCAECQQFAHATDGCLCGPDPRDDPDPEAAADDSVFPASAYRLLDRLMDLNPFTRISAADALRHPFFDAPAPVAEQ